MTKNRKNLIPFILIIGGAILLLAGLVWVVQQSQNTNLAQPTPGSVAQVKRVTLNDAKAAFNTGNATFLDVRSSNSFEATHIPGAVSIPLDELPTRTNELNPKSWIIPY
jgi:3-mercaptopyruvate sulfurtransferase SseA